jgi:hypothetical protein
MHDAPHIDPKELVALLQYRRLGDRTEAR